MFSCPPSFLGDPTGIRHVTRAPLLYGTPPGLQTEGIQHRQHTWATDGPRPRGFCSRLSRPGLWGARGAASLVFTHSGPAATLPRIRPWKMSSDVAKTPGRGQGVPRLPPAYPLQTHPHGNLVKSLLVVCLLVSKQKEKCLHFPNLDINSWANCA